MKKPSSSFLLLVFAALLVSFQSYAQISVEIGRGQGQGQHGQGPRGPRPGQGQGQGQYPGQQPDYGYNDYSQPQSQLIREEVRMNLRSYERMSLSTLLRLSYGQESGMELVTLSVRAQSLMNGPAQLELLQNGRPLSSQTVRRQMNEIILTVPMRTLLSGLELHSVSEIYLESITAQVQSSYNPYPGPGPGRETQVQPNQLVTLSINQSVRGYGIIDLERLANQQMGLTLEGAQIDRVVVQGQSFGRSASVQVELNRRPVGDIKLLSAGQTPLQVQSLEEVRSLALIVSGDAQIQEIRIRVGQVRPQWPQGPQGPQYPGQTQRVYVQQEVSSRYPLSLSSLLPYENRLIRSVTIEARSRIGQSQLMLSAIYGGQQGSFIVNQTSTRANIRLARPMSVSELQLLSSSSVQVEALEIEFDQYYR